MKKRRRLLFVVLPVVVIVSVLLAGVIPVSIPVSITGEGNLSLQTNVVLAAGEDPAPAYQEMIPEAPGSETGLSVFPPKLQDGGNKDNWLSASHPHKDVPVGMPIEDEDGDPIDWDTSTGSIYIDEISGDLVITAGTLSDKCKYDIEITDYNTYGGEYTWDEELQKTLCSRVRARFDDYVYGSGSDLYQLEDAPQRQEELAEGWSRTIEAVRIYAYVVGTTDKSTASTRILTYEKKHDGIATDLTTDEQWIATEYLTNPETGESWTWTEADDLEVGVTLKDGICYKVYVVIEDAIADASYMFNAYITGVWTNPDNMIDEDLGTFGNTSSDGDTQVLTGNTCLGTDLGAISKVEIRTYGYGDGDDRIDLTPVFGGSNDGDEHQLTMPSEADWSTYAEITYDPNAPSWTWSDIPDLDVKVEYDKVAKGNPMYCAAVQIRVTFALGSQTFFPITPTEFVPGGTNDWYDMDVSGSVPEGATGVVLHCINTYTFADYAFGLRKNGSSDNRTDNLKGLHHCWAMIGVDASRYFEAYVGSTTKVDIYVVAYTMAGVTFKTNADDKSLTTLLTWLDIDCSTEAPSAIGLIFEIENTGASAAYYYGLQKNGSSDNRFEAAVVHCQFGAAIGCDTSQICEGYINNVAVDFFLVGYITDGCTFNTNAIDISLDSTAEWLDLTALPAGANMGFIEVITNISDNYGFRKNGIGEDIYHKIERHCWSFVECDASQIIEGKIARTNIDFFVVGYSHGPGVIADVTFVRATEGSTTTSPLTLNIEVSAGTDRVLVIGLAYKSSSVVAPTSIVFNTSENFVLEKTAIDGGDAQCFIYYLTAPTETTADVVITMPDDYRMVGYVAYFTGVDQTNPFTANTSEAQGTDNAPTVDVSSATDEVCIDILAQVSAGPDTATATHTEICNGAAIGGGSDTRGAGQYVEGQATRTMNWSMSSTDNWNIIAGALQPPSAEADISNAPTSKAFGVVAASSTYWSNGSEPTWPLVDGDAYFTITNNGDTCSITVEATNFTGGVGWTLGVPGENTVRLTVFKEGDGSGDGVTLTTSPQAFISGLATNIDWELKFETATSHTDGVGKTSILTLAATLD